MPTARNKAAKVGSGLISIIVPVLNEAASIERFLRCLRERAGDAEVIVVDGGSSDGTFDLARNHCDRCLNVPRGRAVQMNAGARAASGDTLWFVHSDCEVPAGCLQQISDVLRQAEIAGGFFRALCRPPFGHALWRSRVLLPTHCLRKNGRILRNTVDGRRRILLQTSTARRYRDYPFALDHQPSALRENWGMAANSYLWTDCAALSATGSYLSACGHLSKYLRLPKEIVGQVRSG